MSHNLPPSASGSRSLLMTMENTMKSPRPSALFLNKPGNGSSVSVNEVPQPLTPGLRAHIGHLLPRHAHFRAKILIHQISSVPFVSGEFGVRWKLKHVHTLAVHKQGLMDRVRHHGEKKTQSDKGKAREDNGESGWLRDMLSPGAGDRTEEGHVDSNGRRQKGAAPPLFSHGISSISSSSSKTGHFQKPSADSSVVDSLSSISATTVGASTISNDTTTALLNPSSLPISTTPARGMTPFLKLKDHSITWSQQLDPILKLDIDRETSQVMPCPLKLVVMQRVIPDDPEGPPQNPRLGAVYLNLAEYIGHGPVDRRYLLKESKTNATLRITIEMEYVSGETNYIPPPLAKGEILTGLAGFLEHDVVKKRPRALDIYGPYKNQEELEIDLLGTAKTAMPKTARTARTERRASDKSRSSGGGDSPTDSDDDDADSNDGEKVGATFDVQRLPFAYGTKTTEALIEALFNPRKTTEKHQESPFTYYVPPSPTTAAIAHGVPKRGKILSEQAVLGLGMTDVHLDRSAKIGKRQGSVSTTEGSESVYSTTTSTTSSSSASVHTMTSESSRSRAAAHRSNSVGEHGATFAVGGGVAIDRSAPEGRVVVNTPQKQDSTGATGVRGWWKRHKRPSMPTTWQTS